jgi:hypothetical protein
LQATTVEKVANSCILTGGITSVTLSSITRSRPTPKPYPEHFRKHFN